MTRATKKLVYGIVWGFVALIVVAGIFFAARPSPTCTDGIKNQDEQDVDCGGPCELCEIKQLNPVRVLRPAAAFSTPTGAVTIVALVLNPNAGYVAARVPYRFVLYDENGSVVETIAGDDRLFASEARYLYAGDVRTSSDRLARVELVIGDAQWKPRREILRPDVEILSGAETVVRDAALFVRGIVRNQSTLPAERIRVTAMLLDRSGNELFPGQGWVTNLLGTSEAPFTIQFQSDESLALRVDPAATRLFVAVQ
ncbi:MAG: hypothetical protein AAB601_02600 [Patescibacteria group bacterium]